MPSASLELVRPAHWWAPEHDRASSLGPEVGELAAMAGLPPDPEQQLVLDATFAFRRPSGKSLTRDVAICAPRQNLKTGTLKMCALGFLWVTEQPLTVWSAHQFDTSQESFRDMCQLIEGCPDLDREVKHIHRANGEEAIELTGNRRLKFKARTKSGGRGLTGNKVILDEAMYLTPTHMGALVPTLRAVPDPQLLLAGSAGMVFSEVWRSYRDRGRAGGSSNLVWAEWGDLAPGGCAEELCDHRFGRAGCALDDRRRWWATNTALGRRITEETLQVDRESLDAAEFARETLGWWEDPPDGGGVLGLDVWAAMAVGIKPMRAPSLSVEVSLDRTSTTIGAAWTFEGRPHLEIVEERPGTGWVVERVAELVHRYKGVAVVLDVDTEAAALLEAMQALDLPIALVRGPERAIACSDWHESASAGLLSHNGDPAIAAAIASARWKDVGEGRRVLSRRKSAGDISALYAVVHALHGLRVGEDYDLMASIG